MRISDLIEEGVAAHGIELAAYCYVVADQYYLAPKWQEQAAPLWGMLAAHDQSMLSKVLSDVDVEYGEDSYKTTAAMLKDMFVNKRLRIYATQDDGGQEGSHPQFTPEENDVFRTVHDFLGHYKPNQKVIAKAVKNGSKPVINSHNFTVRGEMNTFVTHSRLIPPAAVPALFTEIIGQISTYFATGNYTDNKVAVLSGIDFKNVGKFTSEELEQRKQRYIAAIETGEPFRLEHLPVTISDINWKMLSRSGKK